VKEYAEINNVITTIKEDVAKSVQEVKEEAVKLAESPRSSLKEGTTALRDTTDTVKYNVSGGVVSYARSTPSTSRPNQKPGNRGSLKVEPRKIHIQ